MTINSTIKHTFYVLTMTEDGGGLCAVAFSNLVVDDGVHFFFTPEILKFSEIIHNKSIFFNFCLSLCLSVEKEEVVVGLGVG